MKKILYCIVLVVFCLLANACATDDPVTQDDQVITDTEDPDDDADTTTDTYELIAVTDLGDIVAIGNNTGELRRIDQVNDVNTLGSMGNIASSEAAIYYLDRYYDPGPITELIVYDRLAQTQDRRVLNFPPTITGNDIGIVHLFWSQDQLIAFIAPDVLTGQPPIFYIATIDPVSYEMADTGVSVEASVITSVLQLDDTLYISSWDQTLSRVNLTTGLSQEVVSSTTPLYGSRMAQISAHQIAMLQSEPGFIGGGKPVIVDIETGAVNFSDDPTVYGMVSIFGATKYDAPSNTYFNLVGLYETDSYLEILKVNTNTGSQTTTRVNTTSISRNIIIIDIER